MLVKPKSAFDIYVSAAVRKERMAQRVSQATLAYGIGVSDGFISQVESPKNPSKYNLNPRIISSLVMIFDLLYN